MTLRLVSTKSANSSDFNAVSADPAGLSPDDRNDISSDMATDREYVDLKIEVSEARTEARFAELNGKLDRLATGVEALANDFRTFKTDIRQDTAALRDQTAAEYRSTRTTILTTVIGTGLALLALLVAILSFAGDELGRGLQTRDLIAAVVKELEDKRAAEARPPQAVPEQPR